jgi:hypothetical protein
MTEEKNYLDGIQSPIQKRSIRDIPVPTRKTRANNIDLGIVKNSTVKKTAKKSLDLREEIKKESMGNFINQQREQESITLDDLADEVEEPIIQIKKHSNHNRYNHYDDTEGGGFWPWVLTLGSILVLIALFFGISALFSNAKITITPKTSDLANLSVDIPIINETVGNKELLNYKVLEIDASATKIIDSENEEAVENKASGVITVYNEYTKDPQKLIQNTRFETTEGLVYRIKNSITVPGYTESAGNKNPGSIDVEVFADEAGEKFNIGKTDFKIPGFKNQEQYDFFYAKSKTEMTGGFIGTKNTVSTSTLGVAVTDLQGQITNQILQQIKSQNTENYVYVYSPDNFTFLEPKQNNASGKKVSVDLAGTAKVYVLAKTELSQKIAEKGGRDYDGAPVLVKDLEKLALTIKDNTVQSGENIIQNNDILNVSGDAQIVWQNDLEKVKSDLAGKDKNELSQIISSYPGIIKASATFTLFWNSHFPKNTNKINIEIAE